MEPPKDVKVIETDSSIYWFEDTGLVCSVSKRSQTQTLEEVKNTMIGFMEMIGDRKVCLLADATHSSESTKEVRDYAAAEFPKFVKAMAIISDSALGKMLANLFFKLKTQPYPTRMFSTESDARDWLKQYM